MKIPDSKKFSNWLFCLFIFFLPWQTRFIFTPEKTEFLAFGIYLSEIFLWLALAFWLTNANFKKNKIPFIFLVFYIFSFLSIFWSSDRVSAFRLWLFIFDGIMIYLFLQNLIPPLKAEGGQTQPPPLKVRGGWGELWNSRTGLIYVFLFSLFISSLFGIWQFFNLGSGSFKWLGLAARGAWNLGDIVVAAGSERWLRAYGPFPHPNIFGGYLAAGLILLFNEIKNKTKTIRSYTFCFIYFLSAVLFFALFLTFSRSAWLAFAIASIYFLLKNISPLRLGQSEASRKTLKYFSFLLLLAICLSIIFYPFIKTRMGSVGRLEQKSNTERAASWREGLSVWRQNPIFGSGISNYIATIIPDPERERGNYSGIQKNNDWIPHQVRDDSKNSQPPHNIFILVLLQLGLIGFMIYLFFWRGFWKNPALRPLLILFFVIGMFDHYLWTLWSGQMLFWLSLSLNQGE